MDIFSVGLALLAIGVTLYVTAIVISVKRHNKALRSSEIPVYRPVDESTTCSAKGEPHKWQTVLLMLPNGENSRESLVCLKCGVIHGTEDQFYPEGVEKINAQIKANDDQYEFYAALKKMHDVELEFAASKAENRNSFMEGIKFSEDMNKLFTEKIDERNAKIFTNKLAAITEINKK